MKTNYPLKTLFWETTLRCNAKCAFCGSGCGETQQYPDELTTEEICSALQDIAKKLPVQDIMLNITGGEPLLRKDVFTVASFAASLGFHWGMVTNGSLITSEVIRQMKESGISTLTVSIDGCRSTHEGLRKLPGSFDNIMTALRQIAEKGFVEHLQVTTVVNKQNINELEQLREILLPIGLNSWRVVTADPIGRAKDNENVLLNREGMKKYFDFAEKYRSDPLLPVVQSCSHFFGDREHILRSRSFDCGAGKRVASILYNGDIFVCPNVERRPELIQGNVRSDSLADLWQTGFSFFREKRRTLSESCKDCYYREECGGDSLHTWDFENRHPGFCIRQFYDVCQNTAYFAKQQLYHNTVEQYRKEVHHPSMMRIYTDRPAENRIVLTRTAVKELFIIFDWGKNTEKNKNERMACLIGKQEDSLFIIESVQQITLDFADETTAHFTKTGLTSAFRALEHYRRTKNPDTSILGFVHSHPNELKPILSVSDVKLHHYLMSHFDISLSMLINPQKQLLKAYCGKNLDLSDIRLLECEF